MMLNSMNDSRSSKSSQPRNSNLLGQSAKLKSVWVLCVFMFSAQLPGFSMAADLNNSYSDESTTSVFSRNQNFDSEGVELYESNWQLKSFKKFGFGVAVGGMSGQFGFNVEANIQPSDALALGLGGGSGYNAFSAAWKHNFQSQYLSTYTKVGYAKWFNTPSSAPVARDSAVLSRVLSQNEISQNRFNVDFISGGLGLEYNQLEGELSGVNLFAELIGLTELNRIEVVPTGAIGITYFY